MWSSFKCHNKNPLSYILTEILIWEPKFITLLSFLGFWLHFCSCFWAPNMCYRINKCAGLLGMKFDTTPPPIFWPFRICIARKSVIKLRKYITFDLNLHLGITYWNSPNYFSIFFYKKYRHMIIWLIDHISCKNVVKRKIV